MSIDRLYRIREQEWIERDVLQEKARYAGTPSKAIRYFRHKAEEYHLFERVKNQFNAYKYGILNPENLTTNEEIARLFHCSRSSVSRYLKGMAKKYGKEEDFKAREIILRSTGGKRGGKNGDKAKNFNGRNRWSYRNS